MKWSSEAETAVAKVPFFVRKRVKQRVEEEAARCGASMVTLEHTETCKNRFLHKMEDEVTGYRVEACFGTSGCPNRAVTDEGLLQQIETLAASKKLREFLLSRVGGKLKLHHEFQIVLSDCPNACSRPQIADIGIIGACRPAVSDAECSRCGACVEACRESAIALDEAAQYPEIDVTKCLSCGKCSAVCPTGTLVPGAQGYRVQVGGKLGRHPQLGRELSGIFSREDVLRLTDAAIDFYTSETIQGERFGEVLNGAGYEKFRNFLENRGLLI